MERVCLVILSILLTFGFSGRTTTQETSEGSISQDITKEDSNENSKDIVTNESIPNITKEDLNVYYEDLVINDSIPFKDIADELGIPLGQSTDNIHIKASSMVDGNDYEWYIVYYPSEEKKELEIEYLINNTLKTEYLVYVRLYKAKTSRGVTVGDDLEKLISAYGNSVKPRLNTSTTDWYYYSLDNKSTYSDKSISIIVDKNTNKVTEISINYNNDKAMEDMDIIGMD